MDTMAAAIAEARDTVEDVIEPYLLQQGFIGRTPRGRVVTLRAYKHLGMSSPARLSTPVLPLFDGEEEVDESRDGKNDRSRIG